MNKWFWRRLRTSVLLLLGVTVLNFSIVALAPGSPIDYLTGPRATQEFLEGRRQALGLDKPVAERYVVWVGRLLRGDMGRSFQGGAPVSGLIGRAMKASLLLMGVGLAVGAALALPLEIWSARRLGGAVDRVTYWLVMVGLGWPNFLLALILLWAFTLKLGWLPSGGTHDLSGAGGLADRLRHLALPATVIAFGVLARLLRYVRSLTAQAIGSPYMASARARGLSERRRLWRHCLPNVTVPLLTLLGLEIPSLVGGAAITEKIFQWPGMGTLLMNAIGRRDYPVILGVNLVVACCVVLTNWAVDVLTHWVDRDGSEEEPR